MHLLKRSRSLALLLFFLIGLNDHAVPAQTWVADNGNGTYSNPLFYEEFSDPDMIRVGRDFYLTGTTMHSMPGLPILHSRDLVNWDFVGYALDKLDLGPAYRLEDGKNIYGAGIWAPSFCYHDGTFYIFSNVNGQTTQMFSARNLQGPWVRTPMKRSLHDLSVLFDDDGKTYVVWGYREIHLGQLNETLTDIVPGTERIILTADQGAGEGSHLYKIRHKYYLTTAWWEGAMRMPTARADSLTGPWEVNQNVSNGEDFGLEQGYRLDPEPHDRSTPPPYHVSKPNPQAVARNAIHQGGLIQTVTGEWWGYSMMDANSIGRLLALSPITWQDGWPYFGLPGNLGRTPRTWVKPNTGTHEPIHAPYQRSDSFGGSTLQPIWQWNHVPVPTAWSLTERPGYLRLHALPASDLWHARNTLTQRAIGPFSTATVTLDTAGMHIGDTAGLALFNRPYAWIGVQKEADATYLAQFNEQTGKVSRKRLLTPVLRLRVDCNFLKEQSTFSASEDGTTFTPLGEAFTMVYSGLTFQGVRFALFNFNTLSRAGGSADFKAFQVAESSPHGLMHAIPYGKRIALQAITPDEIKKPVYLGTGSALTDRQQPQTFLILDRGKGRVALQADGGFLSVDRDGAVRLSRSGLGKAETFQWIETFTGELTLLSLQTDRYLSVDLMSHVVTARSTGPSPALDGGTRLRWEIAAAGLKTARNREPREERKEARRVNRSDAN